MQPDYHIILVNFPDFDEPWAYNFPGMRFGNGDEKEWAKLIAEKLQDETEDGEPLTYTVEWGTAQYKTADGKVFANALVIPMQNIGDWN